MAKDASFDIVSENDLQEVGNAVHQAQKELENRFDFKGSKSSLALNENEIVVIGDDEYKLDAVLDVLKTKLVRREVSLKSLDYGKVEPASGGTVRQVVRIKQGLDQDIAKSIIKAIKDSKIKVQASIQGDQVRVSGKNKDDLQAVIQHIKSIDFPVELQFSNYR